MFYIEKKEDFFVPVKGTHQVAYGCYNLFTGVYPGRSLEAKASALNLIQRMH